MCGPLVKLMNNASHIVSNSKAGEREVSCCVGLRKTKVQDGDAARASALITVDCLAALHFVVQSCEMATGPSFSISPELMKHLQNLGCSLLMRNLELRISILV